MALDTLSHSYTSTSYPLLLLVAPALVLAPIFTASGGSWLSICKQLLTFHSHRKSYTDYFQFYCVNLLYLMFQENMLIINQKLKVSSFLLMPRSVNVSFEYDTCPETIQLDFQFDAANKCVNTYCKYVFVFNVNHVSVGGLLSQG